MTTDARPFLEGLRRWPISAWLGIAIAVVFAIWFTIPAWGGRAIGGEDVMFYLIRSRFGISELYAHGRLDGWSPAFYLGHQQFLIRGPDIVPFVATVRLLTLGQLSVSGAVKVIGLAAFVAFPAVVAFLARSYGLGRRAAGIAALLSLLVSNIFGLGLQGLFIVGLLAHQVGALWWGLALGSLLRVIVDARVRWILIGGASCALLAMTHQISFGIMLMALAVSVATLPLTDAITRRALQRLAVAGLLGFGLAAFWAIPRIAHRDLVGSAATWATPPFGDRVAEIFRGDILFRPNVAWILIAGFVYGAVRVAHNRRYALALLVAPIILLAFSHWAAHHYSSSIAAIQLANRGLGYVGVLAVLPLAALLGALATRAARLRPGADLAVVGIVAVAVFVAQGPLRNAPAQFPDPISQMRDAAAELAATVPDGARFATQRDYPAEISRTGVLHPETWLANASGRNLLNGVGLESSVVESGPFEPDQLATKPAADSAAALSKLGVTHVVTTEDDLAGRLADSGNYELEWQESPLAILAVIPPPGQPAPASQLTTAAPTTARLTRGDPEHLEITFNASRRTTAQVAVAWSPKWHAEIDGRAVTLERNPETATPNDDVLRLTLPRGRHQLTLDFRSDIWDRLGVIVTLLTLCGIAGFLVVRRRRRIGAAGPAHSTSSSFSRMA